MIMDIQVNFYSSFIIPIEVSFDDISMPFMLNSLIQMA